jgi:transcriptional regulator with XRE-family HTH domain
VIELVRPLETPKPSPLEAARLRRKLTVDKAAQRAGLSADQVTWLEEGRLYRLGATEDALAVTLVYATALGIGPREARRLAGLSADRGNARGRLAGLLALIAAVAALVGFLVVPQPDEASSRTALLAAAANEPPPWTISVDVLNGNGDINHTRQVATRIGALAYTIDHVGRADRFDYPVTAVYYERGGHANAIRLARELGVAAKPLPGGENPRRLVVVVGPARGPDS